MNSTFLNLNIKSALASLTMSSSSKNPNRGGAGHKSTLNGFLVFFSGALTTMLLMWMFPSSEFFFYIRGGGSLGIGSGRVARTFYDDPKLSFMIGESMDDWDEKREEWVRKNPAFGDGGRRGVVAERMLVVTGSQLKPCKNPVGDNLLLRSFKNKVDYCRIHGYDVFYNNLLLQPEMRESWAKLPAIRASMLAQPEVEWILWMDDDAFFTDMDFKFPFQRYKDHNFVVEGWNTYERRTFTSINAGVFLIRNCQWSMDFMEMWAKMGPKSRDFAKWGKIQQTVIKDKTDTESDDQSALLYLMLKKRKTWGDKIFLEEDLSFQSHWIGVMEQLDNFTKVQVEKDRSGMKHAEKVTSVYDTAQRLKSRGWLKPPIMIHFAGCQPCSGKHNPAYRAEDCWEGMNRALTYADNQVLRNFRLVHLNLSNASSVSPLNHL